MIYRNIPLEPHDIPLSCAAILRGQNKGDIPVFALAILAVALSNLQDASPTSRTDTWLCVPRHQSGE
jgi:hypothetical protein